MLAFRFDRFATLHLFHPLAKWSSRSVSMRIPILMYHSIGTPTVNGHPYYQTDVSPELFAQHMHFLREHGYSSIAVQDVWPQPPLNSLPERPVIITFDDGYRDFHTKAFPVLHECEFTATVYLPTAYISNERQTFKGKECLTWNEINELQQMGIQFGSHTVTHAKLVDLSWEAIDHELANSKHVIEDRLGVSISSFCYPYAFPSHRSEFTTMLRELLKKHHYQNGVCTVIGRAKPGEDPYFLKRIPLNSGDDLLLFRAKLEGGYDWLQTPQYLSKKVGLKWT